MSAWLSLESITTQMFCRLRLESIAPQIFCRLETVAKQLKPRSGELPNRAVSVFYQDMCDRQLCRAADEAAYELMSSTHVTVVVVMMAYMTFHEHQLLWTLHMSSN